MQIYGFTYYSIAFARILNAFNLVYFNDIFYTLRFHQFICILWWNQMSKCITVFVTNSTFPLMPCTSNSIGAEEVDGKYIHMHMTHTHTNYPEKNYILLFTRFLTLREQWTEFFLPIYTLKDIQIKRNGNPVYKSQFHPFARSSKDLEWTQARTNTHLEANEHATWIHHWNWICTKRTK